MIVVIGAASLRMSDGEGAADGLAIDVASVAVAEGSIVEFIAKIGDDPAGDELMLALARIGVGHLATLRDASNPTTVVSTADDAMDPGTGTDAALDVEADQPVAVGPALEPDDVGLALRYLTEFRVVVAIHVAPEVLVEVAAVAAWASAHVIAVVQRDADSPSALPGEALVVIDGSDEGGSAVGAAIGRYAVALDRGEAAAAAYATLIAEVSGS